LSRSSGTDAFPLPWMRLDSTYEGALVFHVPEPVVAAVQADREAVGRSNGVQEPPHVTLLYLGHVSGHRLLQLQDRLVELRDEALTARASHVGTFESAGHVTNVHVRLEHSAALAALHERALSLASAFAWFDPGPFCGRHYLPHMSIFSRIAWPSADRGWLERMGPWAGRPLELSGLTVMADPVTAL
jgi:2'-5' RNA ligase